MVVNQPTEINISAVSVNGCIIGVQAAMLGLGFGKGDLGN